MHRLAALATSAALTLMLTGVPAAVAPVAAVHNDGLFQLDYVTTPTPMGAANVSSTNISPPGNTGDDWDKVYAGTSSAFVSSFVTDTYGTAEDSFFTGGGSKDERDISGGSQHWEWDDTNDVIPDKDDITHAFAAAYVNPADGHTIFYFGADRFDTSGSAELGFWFFREPVTLGTKPAFNGVHSVGDILVLVNWGGGDQIGDLEIFQWVGGKNPLALLADNLAADCSLVASDDRACAVVNTTGGETPPWLYTNKDGQHAYQELALFEAGIDVNALLNVTSIGCYGSFLAETRSSHSTDAQLKDFALGGFPVCDITVTKTGDTLSKIGDPVDYSITIENTGRATLYKRNITDTLLGAIATDGVNQANSLVLTNTCGASLAAGATCTITARRTVAAGDPDPLPNTVTILYTERQDWTGLSFTRSDDHSVNLFQPAVKIDKTGDTLSKVTDPVSYTFTITNLSSSDSPNLALASISDNVIGNLATQATAAGCDVLTKDEVCSFSVSRTVAQGDPDPLVNTVDVLYHPVGYPNDITASDGHSVNLFQPSVSVEKTGDTLSKIGDAVTYHVKITNTGSSDSPALLLDSITDDVLGDLADEAPAACDSIAAGGSCEFDVPWTVAAVDLHPKDGQDDDPVINTVTVHFHPAGYPNDITATASHELNLFQPSITFAKTADTRLSKVTDVVNYTLTLNNTSSADTPSMSCTISDPLLGVDKTVTLAAGEGDVTDVAYTVPSGAADPLVNTASVTCTFDKFPNVLSKSDGWEVNLFQPGVKVEKSGDALSKIGDEVTYTYKITNTSSADSPHLVLDNVVDDILGTLTAPAACQELASGASCQFSAKWTVLEGSPDPLVNKVEVNYHPLGFPNKITDDDTYELNLFQPSITFDKSADTELSKIGDVVNYTLTTGNTSSADTPDLVCTITDPLLGVDRTVTLASGATDTFPVAYTVPPTADDPLVNTASVSCSPTGFPNVLTGSDGWSVNLFQPQVQMKKTGPAYSKAGDTVTYGITIKNASSADTPDLVLDSFTDTLVPGAVPPAACSTLVPGASCSFTYTYLVKAGDPDPIENVATVHYHPAGFPNDITVGSYWDTDQLHPSFTVTKDCKAGTQPVPQAGPAVFTITFNNTGDADLHVVPSEGAPFDVAAGASHSYDYSIPGPFTATVPNTVTGTVTLAAKYELSNSYPFEASGSCVVEGKAKVVKTVSGQPPAAGQVFTFELRKNASTLSDGTTLETKTTDAAGNISFATSLVPGDTYQLCEIVLPGWNTSLGSYGTLFVPNSMSTPTLPNPNVNNMTVCVDFTVASAETKTFTVDNSPPPGGRALTIGFWKNWASCSNSKGGQEPVLDQTLALAGVVGDTTHVGHSTLPGIVLSATSGSYWQFGPTYYLVIHGDAATPDAAPDCQAAVRILNKSTIDMNKKKASDPAFNLAAQLLGAELNLTAGAYTNPTVINTVNLSVLILGSVHFDGITHTPISKADAALMNSYAKILDDYNNNR